jgi:hypothetical protein
MIFGQQYFLDRFCVLTGLTDPIDDCVLLVPFGSCQTADPTPFRDERQRLNDLILWRPAAIKDRAFGFCECLFAGLASVPLSTSFGLAILCDVVLEITLALTVVWTALIWTKVTYVSKLGHRPLLVC